MAREMSPVFMIRAKELFDAGKFSAAIMTLQEGLQQYPHFISARVLLGEIFWTSGDASHARAELEQVIKAVPDNFAAHRKLALIYREAGELPAAIQSCRSVLRANPRDLEMRVLLDQLQGTEGQVGEVERPVVEAPPVAAIQKPSVVPPADAGATTAHVTASDAIDSETLAELYIVQGHRDKGLQIYRRLHDKYPANQRYYDRIQILEELPAVVEAQVREPLSSAPPQGAQGPLHPPTLDSAKTESFTPGHPPTLDSAKTESFSPDTPDIAPSPTPELAKTSSFSSSPDSAKTESFSPDTPDSAPSPTPELAKTSSFSRSPESVETDSLSPLHPPALDSAKTESFSPSANRRVTQVRRLEGWLQVVRARRRV